MFKDDFIPTNENSTFRNSNIAYDCKFFKGNPLNNTVKISCKKPLTIVKSRRRPVLHPDRFSYQ